MYVVMDGMELEYTYSNEYVKKEKFLWNLTGR